MVKLKSYRGYESANYIASIEGRWKFKLTTQLNRVRSTRVSLTKEEEDRVEEILEKNVAISLHDHSIVFPENPEDFIEYIRSGRWAIGYEGLAASGLDAVFDGMMDGIAVIRSSDPWDWDNVIHQIGMIRSDMERQEMAFVACKLEEVEKAHKEGRVAIILHLEGPPRIGEDLAKLDILYGLGVRCMGIAYSRGNEFGAGLADKVDKGLSDLGYEYVERLNKLGIAIDLAHAGDKTSLEVIEASKEPVFITHAGARTLWPSKRMKPDDVIHALAEKGGVFGIEAAPHTTVTKGNLRHSLESVMEHFQYVENLVGIEHVAFGPDTLFGDHVSLHKIFRDYLAIRSVEEGLPDFPRVDYVDGLENPSEFKNIVRWLVRNGYSDQQIAKVIGGNVLRVLRRAWKVSERPVGQ